MKIQLKRSNALDNGKAKEPTEDQMEYGELAVNFNDADPALFIKDSDNKIIRIGGVGNIADDGQTEIPASPNPPLNPQPGNFWYNSEDGRLYYYYEDANSSQWVDASPDSQSNPVESGPTFPATALPDDLFFNTTDGRLYIYYKDGDSEQWVDASPDIQPQTNDLWKRDGTTVLPKTTGDSVEIGGTAEGNGKITLAADGTISAASKITSGAQQSDASETGVEIRPDGRIFATGDTGAPILTAYTKGNSTPQVNIKSDGSSKFNGDMAITADAGSGAKALTVQNLDTTTRSLIRVQNDLGTDSRIDLAIGSSGNSGVSSYKDIDGSFIPSANLCELASRGSNIANLVIGTNSSVPLKLAQNAKVRVEIGSQVDIDVDTIVKGDVKIGITGSFTPSTPAISLDATEGSAVFEKSITAAKRLGDGKRFFVSGSTGNVYIGQRTPNSEASCIINSLNGSIISESNIQSTSQNGGQLAGFRNQLINGDFRVWQRGTTVTYSGAGSRYTADCWKQTGDTVGATVKQSTTAPAGFAYSAELSADCGAFQYGVELDGQNNNSQFPIGSVWTLSVWSDKDITAYASKARFRKQVGIATGQVEATSGVPNWSSTGETSNGFTRYKTSFTITGDASTGTGEDLVCLNINLVSPSDLGSITRYAGVQLEPGPVATPFEHRPITTEIALCQRYYQIARVGGKLGPQIGRPGSGSKKLFMNYMPPVALRAAGTVSVEQPSAFTSALEITTSASGITAYSSGMSLSRAYKVGVEYASTATPANIYGWQIMLKLDAEL